MDKQNSFLTESISQFITGYEYKNVPPDVEEKVKEALTDYIGVTLAGNEDEISKIMHSYIRFLGGEPHARVIGSGHKTSVENAALVNGVLAHALDFDDWSVSFYGHSSIVLAPCLFALGEKFGYSGKDIIAAYTVGFEINALIPWIVKRAHTLQGWHVTATLGTIGAAAAVCNLLRLSVQETQMALSLATSLACGVKSNFGTMVKPFHAGNAAANGIKAALLVKEGLTAADNIFDLEYSLVKAFGYNEKVDWLPMVAKLGKEYKLASAEGINIKPYPSCGSTLFAIDTVKKLHQNHEFRLEDITEMELWVNPSAALPLIHHNPEKGIEGKFSLEYTVARALVSKHVTLEHFTDEAVNEPIIKELIGKMRWCEKYPMPKEGDSNEFDPKGVLIRLKDGRELFDETFICKGMPQNPMLKEEIDAKFYDCALTCLNREKADKALGMLTKFEDINDINMLMDVLC